MIRAESKRLVEAEHAAVSVLGAKDCVAALHSYSITQESSGMTAGVSVPQLGQRMMVSIGRFM